MELSIIEKLIGTAAILFLAIGVYGVIEWLWKKWRKKKGGSNG